MSTVARQSWGVLTFRKEFWTRTFFSKAKRELESLMQQKGMCTLWFTFSAADNHWRDFHTIANPMNNATNTTTEIDEKEKAIRRRKIVRDNLHVDDFHFHKGFGRFVNFFFGKDCLNASWYWYRTEYQKRGCPHIHGCCRLTSDHPGLHELGQKVVHARQAQIALQSRGLPLPSPCFSIEDTEDDKILISPTADFDETLTLQQTVLEDLTQTIREGVDAQTRMLNYYNNYLITTMHPSPPTDATSDDRDPKTRFEQTETSVHPCHMSNPDLNNLDYYLNVTNACQRHKCNSYCQRCDKNGKTYCQMGYPQSIRHRSIVVVKQDKTRY